MKTTPQTFLKFIAGAAVAAAVLFLVWYFSSIVVYILISAVLAVVGNPLVKTPRGAAYQGLESAPLAGCAGDADRHLGGAGHAVLAVRAACVQ